MKFGIFATVCHIWQSPSVQAKHPMDPNLHQSSVKKKAAVAVRQSLLPQVPLLPVAPAPSPHKAKLEYPDSFSITSSMEETS